MGEDFKPTTHTEKEESFGTEAYDSLPEDIKVRRNLIFVATQMLGAERSSLIGCDDIELAQSISEKFQTQLRSHYESSGIQEKIVGLKDETTNQLDRHALNLVAAESQGVHGWVDMLPTLREKFPSAGLNCTMGSAMLKLALEDLGYQNINTTIRKGHSVVTRSLDDGSIVLYDPTSLSTQDNELVGYVRIFALDEVSYREEITEKGFRFGLRSQTVDPIGGFMEAGEEVAFFAYEPGTIMDTAVALENLSEIKDDAEQLSYELELPFDEDAYRIALAEFVAENNTQPLSQDDLRSIALSNRQTIAELVQNAAQAFAGKTDIPNPYLFISDSRISPRSREGFPDPKNYHGSSERYEQASELIKIFPHLEQLDFKTLKQQINIFDAHDVL